MFLIYIYIVYHQIKTFKLCLLNFIVLLIIGGLVEWSDITVIKITLQLCHSVLKVSNCKDS